ncbi:putative gmc oxidoreductase protein [Neofusicoccum parvum UCRNP2]|uniref:Putative gmc oxidoreductase protein n=1 Tax=Botryosphaeria parva (strain UCR-NP2) TaxID=1287680 RepID=R1EHY0_BOTPV|nr:putative gmc oxidoreductase protein [Neofusicoccum parvum UCRNP2]
MPSPSYPLFALSLILSIAATEPVRQHAAPFKLTGTSFGIPGVDATYDYVVVGAGIAGSVVAARLAEDPTVSVAVVEAGGFYEFSNGNLSQIPFYSGRGTVGAYAQWAELVGDDSYLYENMQQYFEKSVNFSTANFGKRAENTSVTFNPNSYSSSGGPLQVSYPSYAHPITSSSKDTLTNSAATGSVIYEVSLTTWQAMTDPAYAASQTDLYLKSGSGQLTNSGGDFFAWEKLPPASRSALPPSSLAALSTFPADWPEVEYILSSSTKAPASVPAAANRSLASIGVALTAALSRGNVTLASADPADLPIVQLNFLLDETDRAVAVAAWRRAREAWRGVPDGVRLGKEVFPGEDMVADEELVEMVRETARPVHHVAASYAHAEKLADDIKNGQ